MKRIFLVGLALSMVGSASAASVEERLKTVEALVNSQALVQTSEQMQQLQDEFRLLRGDVEVMQRELSEIKQQQKTLYEDVDRKIRNLELELQQVREKMVAGQPVAPSAEGAPSAKPLSTTTPATAQTFENEIDAYQFGFNLLKDGRYDQAREAFTQFIDSYPNGQYVDNAQYWLGEINYVTRNFESALGDFIKVKELHKDSPKVPDAKLKIGYVYYELGQWKNARQALDEVIEQFPNSTSASLAKTRLQRMKKEGR